MEDQKKVMLPAQHFVACILASAYGHYWSRYGYREDGSAILDIDEINRISTKNMKVELIPGIPSPTAVIKKDGMHIIHTTSTKRLSWDINESGDVELSIFRPGSILVARVQIKNRNRDWREPQWFPGQITIPFNKMIKTDASYPDRWQWDDGWMGKYWPIYQNLTDAEQVPPDYAYQKDDRYAYAHYAQCAIRGAVWANTFGYRVDASEGLHDDFLFSHHVYALKRALIALFMSQSYVKKIKSSIPEFDAAKYENYEEYRMQVLQPAYTPVYDQINLILQPLYNIALPDTMIHDPDSEDIDPEYSFTYVSHEYGYYLIHRGEETFPVESEKTAVNAVLRLKKDQEQYLQDVAIAAMKDSSYRP